MDVLLPAWRTVCVPGRSPPATLKDIMKRTSLLLAGIGCTLIGLLAGILFMLVVDDEPAPRPMTRVVDRVELGSDQPPLRTTESDSGMMRDADVPSPTVLNGLFRQVADRVTPTVVFIQVRTGSPDRAEDGPQEFEGDMRDFFRRRMPRRSVGSGVLISPQGYIVTNNHVVEQSREIQVTLTDKRQFDARVVGRDASTDLAVLKIDSSDPLPAIRLGDSEDVGVGDWVVAVGNPFRLTSTVTAGIVSALGRQVNIIEDSYRLEDFIQTDAAINPGNSGGALVNLSGELVGVNTAIATESGSYEGYGFAVPSNLVERVAEDLINYGEVRRGFLGVSIGEIDAERARELGLSQIQGVYIAGVRTGGAADDAGVEEGDVVLSVNGTSVDAPNELQSAVARYRPGEPVRLTVWRDGQRAAFTVELMGRDDPAYEGWLSQNRPERTQPTPSEPDPAPSPDLSDGSIREIDRWGIGIRPLQSGEQAAFGVDAGVYIAYVEKDSPADAAGIPRDVILTAVDGEPVASPAEAEKKLAAAGTLLLRVQRRDGTSAFYEVK